MKKSASHLLIALSGCSVLGCATPNSNPASTQLEKPSFHLSLDESALPPVNRLTKADLSAESAPCDNFAAHVNGKWLNENDLPGDRTAWGAFEMLDERSKAVQKQLAEQAAAQSDGDGVVKIVGDLWATGMNESAINAAGIAPLAGRMAEIQSLKTAADVVDYLRVSAARGENLIFGFGPEADFKDSSQNIAYATQGGLGLPDPAYYRDEDKKEKRAAYLAHIQRVLELSGWTTAKAAQGADAVMAFETRLAKVSKTREELSRDVSLWYNPVTLEQADNNSPAFSWSRFFESQGLSKPQRFSLAMPEFHAELSRMLTDVSVADWQAYLRFHTVDSASPYLADAFATAHYNFYKKALRGQKEMRPRYKRVLATINGEVGEALGQLYVDVAFPPASKDRMEQLVEALGAALKNRLENLSWMSADTKAKALEKWSSFTPKIGYPDKWRSWNGLETQRDNYLDNVYAARRFNYLWSLSKVDQPVDKSEWSMSPQTVNAYYNPLANEIVFPAAILQAPFFDADADDAVNFGGIGAVIGHEMIHGYDDQGSRFGPTGNFEVWWTDDDSKQFSEKTARLVGQFDAYEAMPGAHVNGKLTLGENIADLGGLAVAYDALMATTNGKNDPYVDELTRDQRFFMNWATVWRRKFTEDELKVRLETDPHAPANFRAIGAPSNLEAFARAFSCKESDNMVRQGKEQIVIW